QVNGNERKAEDELGGEVAIARRVQTIAGDFGEVELPRDRVAVDGQPGPGQRRGPERQDVDAPAAVGEALAVALELLDVGEEVVRSEDRLGSLQVRVRGDDHVPLALGQAEECALQIPQPVVEVVDRLADPEPDVGDDLVVAAAGSMELPAQVAQLADEGGLDVSVDVLK